MKKLNYLSWLFVGMIALSSCKSESPSEDPIQTRSPIELSAESSGIAEDLDAFYFSFTKDMARYGEKGENVDPNMICSPLSAAFLYGMLGNGLDGQSEQDYLSYMGISSFTTFNDFAKTMLGSLNKSDSKTYVKIANSAWFNTQNNTSVSKGYSSLLTNYYNATVGKGDFIDESFKGEVRKWHEANLGQSYNLTDFLTEESAPVSMFNLISFNSIWAEENLFDTAYTRKDVFRGSLGNTMVDMMVSKEFSVNYSADENFEYVNIPFGNYTYSMDIVLPKEGLSLEESSELLTYPAYTELRRKAQEDYQKIFLYFPRFSLTVFANISDMMGRAFGGRLSNNLESKMFDERKTMDGLNISQTLTISFDEEGVRTHIASNGNNTYIADAIVPVNIDRPFYFFIREYSTGACVMSGRITDIAPE